MSRCFFRTRLVDVCFVMFLFFFKQKTAYEMRISDWSSDVCSSDLMDQHIHGGNQHIQLRAWPSAQCRECQLRQRQPQQRMQVSQCDLVAGTRIGNASAEMPGDQRSLAFGNRRIRRMQQRSEEHTSELQSLMRISYAVFCLKNKNNI